MIQFNFEKQGKSAPRLQPVQVEERVYKDLADFSSCLASVNPASDKLYLCAVYQKTRSVGNSAGLRCVATHLLMTAQSEGGWVGM